jgi:hypothetical protein
MTQCNRCVGGIGGVYRIEAETADGAAASSVIGSCAGSGCRARPSEPRVSGHECSRFSAVPGVEEIPRGHEGDV